MSLHEHTHAEQQQKFNLFKKLTWKDVSMCIDQTSTNFPE